MKVAIVRGGGIAGIPTTTRLQSAALPPAEAEELESKVKDASLLSAPAAATAAPAAPPHPDGLLYEVTVGDGGQEHTHRFSEEAVPDEVRSLIEWVDSRPERDFKAGA